jgi:hypothetical protein
MRNPLGQNPLGEIPLGKSAGENPLGGGCGTLEKAAVGVVQHVAQPSRRPTKCTGTIEISLWRNGKVAGRRGAEKFVA